MNLYNVKAIASKSEMSVKNSFAFARLKPIAEPLAIPTCSVSFISVIFIMSWLLIQVGFQLCYVNCLGFVVSLHYSPAVRKSLKVNLVPCLGVSRFILE
jgi:hypothetical protein